jgi:hypothetical protein
VSIIITWSELSTVRSDAGASAAFGVGGPAPVSAVSAAFREVAAAAAVSMAAFAIMAAAECIDALSLFFRRSSRSFCTRSCRLLFDSSDDLHQQTKRAHTHTPYGLDGKLHRVCFVCRMFEGWRVGMRTGLA